jgi:hypothetical protein
MPAKIQSEIEIILDHEVPYSFNGSDLKTKKIILVEPNAKQSDFALETAQCVMRAIRSLQESENNSEKIKSEIKNKQDNQKSLFDSEDVIGLLMMAPSTDFTVVLSFVKNLFFKGCALMDGKQAMGDLSYDHLLAKDKLKLAGEFIANFLLPLVISPPAQN